MPTTTQAPASQRVKDALLPFVDRGAMAGAVALVADSEKIVSVDTVGYTDIAAKKPMPADAMFWIASMTKPLTGMALMMLVDEGKVSVDEPVETYLPEMKDLWVETESDENHRLLVQANRPITVRDIMTHCSGMPFIAIIEKPTLDVLPLRYAVYSYTVAPLQHQPGAVCGYSNQGINTVGRIIEVVSGMPYETFLDERLLIPLGMTDTTFWPNTEQISRLAKIYTPNEGRDALVEIQNEHMRAPLSDRSRFPVPAGGLYSTASDMARFCRMVLRRGELDGKRYVSEASVAESTRRQVPDGVEGSFGLTWAVNGDDGAYGHGGAYATGMNVDPARDLVTIFMVQAANGFPLDGGEAIGSFMAAARGV